MRLSWGWHDVVWAYAKQFGIDKLKWIVPGGNSGQESIRNGVYGLEDKCSEDDIVIIHDGIRPLVDASVLSDVIETCRKYGNGVTSMPYNEQIFVKDDEISTVKYIPREMLRRVQTPQAYKFGKLDWAYHKAFEDGIGVKGSSYTNTMKEHQADHEGRPGAVQGVSEDGQGQLAEVRVF